MTQSAPALASALEMLAPGSICQNPMAGALFSVKTLLSLLACVILVSAAIVNVLRAVPSTEEIVVGRGIRELSWQVTEVTMRKDDGGGMLSSSGYIRVSNVYCVSTSPRFGLDH